MKRYGLDFDILHNGAAEELFFKSMTKHKKDLIIIRYIGSLLNNHHSQAFEDIAEAVKIFNKSNGSACLEIYGGEWNKEFALSMVDDKNIFYKGRVSRSEGYEIMKTADLLVIPVTFSENNCQIRLSLPTKLSEYLASGTPTLIYGPKESGPTEYCLENDLGIVQTKRSVSDLVKLLNQISKNKEKFRKKALKDREFARKHLSAKIIRNKFHKLVLDAVEKGTRRILR